MKTRNIPIRCGKQPKNNASCFHKFWRKAISLTALFQILIKNVIEGIRFNNPDANMRILLTFSDNTKRRISSNIISTKNSKTNSILYPPPIVVTTLSLYSGVDEGRGQSGTNLHVYIYIMCVT